MNHKMIKLTPPSNPHSLKIELNLKKEPDKLEMMWKHYAFLGQLNKVNGIDEEEYVTREAIISCSLGKRYIKLDLCEDHGIIATNQRPLMTCEDCNVYKNISSFDICKGMPSFMDNHCIPVITKVWIQKEGNLFLSDGPREKYIEALRSGAYLTCIHGGLITIAEVLSDQSTTGSEEPYDFYVNFYYDWMKEDMPSTRYVTPEFLKKVDEISQSLEINPDDLMAVMAYESWFNPAAKNASGAVGLIQFTQSGINGINKANGTNYTKTSILAMNSIDQLDVVYLFLKPYKGKMHNLSDVYMAVFAPAHVGEDDNSVVYSKEKSLSSYEANKPLDKNNKGYITVGDAVDAVLDRREQFE